MTNSYNCSISASCWPLLESYVVILLKNEDYPTLSGSHKLPSFSYMYEKVSEIFPKMLAWRSAGVYLKSVLNDLLKKISISNARNCPRYFKLGRWTKIWAARPWVTAIVNSVFFCKQIWPLQKGSFVQYNFNYWYWKKDISNHSRKQIKCSRTLSLSIEISTCKRYCLAMAKHLKPADNAASIKSISIRRTYIRNRFRSTAAQMGRKIFRNQKSTRPIDNWPSSTPTRTPAKTKPLLINPYKEARKRKSLSNSSGHACSLRYGRYVLIYTKSRTEPNQRCLIESRVWFIMYELIKLIFEQNQPV